MLAGFMLLSLAVVLLALAVGRHARAIAELHLRSEISGRMLDAHARAITGREDVIIMTDAGEDLEPSGEPPRPR